MFFVRPLIFRTFKRKRTRSYMKSLAQLGEFGLIDEIRRWSSPSRNAVIGIGDDAAIFRGSRDSWCFTTDTIVENVHFTRSARARDVGWKAMAVNVSDVAAVGGIPKFAVMSLTVPRWVTFKYVKELYGGVLRCARHFNLDLVGGDTVKGRDLSITISLLGLVAKKELVLRRGARSGDDIFVTGSLGGSLSGKHLRFLPRLSESRFLVQHFHPSAMIDISDGLLQDLGHILKESKVGAEIRLDQVPISDAARKRCRHDKDSALASACRDGEDFELLFTLPSRSSSSLEKAWAKKFKTRLSKIGKVLKSPGKLLFLSYGRRMRDPRWFKKRGFRHF